MDTAVVLLNLGGPDSLKAVRPFLYNLFSDREIIRLGPAPLQRPIAFLISTLRAKKTKKCYSLIGGKSPILEITLAQADALSKSIGLPIYIAMRYWHPSIEETLRRAKLDGIKRVFAISLYPQWSRATTGSSINALLREAKRFGMECRTSGTWFDNPFYIDALCDLIKKGIEGFSPKMPFLLFSAHSLPKKFIEEGDPYVEETLKTISLVMEKLEGLSLNWRLCYQSKSGPVKWLEPSTEEALRGLSSEGIRDVLLVPISFVSDHIETLYEVDILYRKMAEDMGITLRRTESLNTHPFFISALKDIAIRGLKEAGWL